jgi:hypothetical protein
MNRTLRKFLIGLSILLVLIGIAGVVFAKFYLDPLLKERLVDETTRTSNGLFALQIDRLHVNIFTRLIEAEGIQLTTDSICWDSIHLAVPNETPFKIDLKVHRLRLTNINLLQYWRTKDLALGRIIVIEPQITLESVRDSVLAKSPDQDSLIKGMLERLPILIAPFAKSIHIGTVTAIHGKMSSHTLLNKKSSYQQADSIGLAITNIHLVANDTSETGRALYADDISINLHNYELYPTGDLYGYRIQAATFDGKSGIAKLDRITIQPKTTDAVFMQQLTVRVPRLKIRMQEILIRKFNLFQALHKKALNMEAVVVESATIEVYQNKNLPLSRHKKMPHELFRAIKPYLNIDTILLRNSKILYTEYKGTEEGKLDFENVNGVLLNITNDTLKMSAATPARVDARAELLGAGVLDLSLQLPLLSSNFQCDYTANLGIIDVTLLNQFVVDKNNIRVESGDVEQVFLKVKVRNGLAKGTLEATYDDLKISILGKKTGDKKTLVSAIANIVLRGKNEKGSKKNPFKVGTIYYKREPTDGILRFISRTAQMGLLETLVPRNISGGKLPD